MTFYARFLSHCRRVGSRLRIAGARSCGVIIGRDCEIAADCDFALGYSAPRRGSIILGERSRLARGVIIHPYGGRVEIQDGVYLGPYTTIYGHGGVTIGDDTLVSMHCRILSSNHAIPAPGTAIRSQPDIRLATRIGCDVWLGAGVTILGGVTIGDGCVVGAGAVVTRDLPPNSIAHGVPARIVGSRGAG